jgi:flagellar hook-length control protein FliK
MPNGVSASAAPAPQNVSPAEVASQIAHQADLFRLPGNRGVRIQLHPEELGGVQVTVRYAPNSGGLELHINVEHASTGDLVQAGWTQLRDALATQGISPDRLVVSVTGPHNASQLDFSSNGGGSGYRPDQGLATFTQTGDQSSQQRSGNDSTDGRDAARVWSSARESASSSSSSDEAQGSAATPSRIDYRV